jgi:precorrin-2/cobalt-factor-2 C20-methyltransferase
MIAGKLIGVGTGPGDPELLTMKAVIRIVAAEVIAYPTLADRDSFARSIVEQHIPTGAREIRVEVPMSVEREPAQLAYDTGAAEISAVLSAGTDVVFLCEGDPLFYGSFMYLLDRLCPDFDVEVVPGITSFTAATASLALPLVSRNDILAVIPGPIDSEQLKTRISSSDATIIMKVGRHLPKIRDAIDALGLLEHATYVERASLSAERTMPLSEAPESAPYFSMILVTKGSDPWLKNR